MASVLLRRKEIGKEPFECRDSQTKIRLLHKISATMEACVAQTCASAATASSPAFLFTQLIKALLVAQCSITSQHDYPVDRTQEILDQNLNFDFIVAGGGSAGSVLANRLTENPDWRVLLVEQGDDPSLASDIPGFQSLLRRTHEDYNYKVEPSKYLCQGMKNRSCSWPAGKALGGSSVINAMIYVRGTKQDFDGWKDQGNDDWGYEDVLPYFLKIENYHPEVVAKHGDKFGTGGPLTLRPYNYSVSGAQDLLLEAAKELGIPVLDMLNTEKNIGFGKAYGALENGVRQNDAKAYLNPIRDRSNLYVMKSARVDSVVIAGKRATGVKVTLKSGRQVELKAQKEVIVSSGTLASPHILMLSGIGPREELERHNIDVVADLPVGKHLQNHLIWMGVYLTFLNKSAQASNSQENIILDKTYEYLLHRKGELSTGSGTDLLGFVNTKDPNAKYPNLQFHFVPVPQNQPMRAVELGKALNFVDDFISEMVQLNSECESIIFGTTLLHPKSEAQLKLKSTYPEDQIEIHTSYLDNQEDIDLMLEGLDIARDLLKTKPFKDLDAKLHRLNIAGCTAYPTDSREYWECNMRHTTATIYHPTGSCKMGPNSKDSVVDNNLRVHGVEGLRVIDASIMPEITSANIHATVLMIAEKGADMIKKEWTVKAEL
ncbi:glucose dehydrogenase [FAD, quinone]-like [Copidosoma floridanum]|uniref:glucose dehydrogenase [FAD, quinone]-like n=1 Tax=Copidosoma floridanum TaxID=29053 RepID=UPI000C6F571F|nr:glucose dehydrogenase [FAD, quinone]-like [Copidosoma floridanum]